MPFTTSRAMNAKLTTGLPNGMNSGHNINKTLVQAIYSSPAKQNFAFYNILGNKQVAKRIVNYPNQLQNYRYLRNKYGSVNNRYYA